MRKRFPCIVASLLATLLTASCSEQGEAPSPQFSVVEASFSELQAAMADGKTSSTQIVQQYLDRIARYEPALQATMAVNPNALARAELLDEERAAGQLRGPLHGIPIALKDNIHTIDMPTTGGALAFRGYVPPYEATLVTRLRDAGAIILAKTTLTELANWVGTGMPGNYNTLRGYGYNPYDPRPDPRQGLNDGRGVLGTGGSSSGIGTAANFWAANVGTETSGSILSPANDTMLAAIKPTVGRISRHGIIPITADQDTAGPLAKSVEDAAALLAAMEGKDESDSATGSCPRLSESNYQKDLTRDALQGARIGIPRAYFYEPLLTPFSKTPVGGLDAARAQAMEKAIALLRAEGAIIVDPVQIPSIAAATKENSALQFGICYDAERGKNNDRDCSVILKYGMKRDFNAWLASLGESAPVSTLTELRKFNTARAAAGAIRYGQAQLDISDEMDVTADAARYQADRAKDIRLSRVQGIDAALSSHKLDALLMPSWYGEEMLNKAGYPAVIVPYTTIVSDHVPTLPANFKPLPARFGITFYGTACSEARLIALAYGFEQANKGRFTPPQFP